MDRDRHPCEAGDRDSDVRPIWPRYFAHQVPGWVAVAGAASLAAHFDWIALGWVFGLVGIVVAKDLLLYPRMRAAYAPTRLHGPESLLSRLVRVERPLDPEGRVRLGPEIWRARSEPSAGRIERGEVVVVREVRGLELLVDRPGRGEAGAAPVRAARAPDTR
ncbi:MAG: NfeD family protein [Myxococcota bacterium]